MSQNNSAVSFQGNARMHAAIAAHDLERSLAFYTTLFNAKPTKLRPGYAKFELAEPSLNFSLHQAAGPFTPATGQHFGVQVKSSAAVESELARLEHAGLACAPERTVTCCYAIQDKFWVTDPDGNPWEIFVVTDNDAQHYRKPLAEAACCSQTGCPAT